uniref:Uncharacterized protein n=1 Tax=Setaria digitata TaxID=48799 RepID=A0A915PET3_9BILA
MTLWVEILNKSKVMMIAEEKNGRKSEKDGPWGDVVAAVIAQWFCLLVLCTIGICLRQHNCRNCHLSWQRPQLNEIFEGGDRCRI